MLISPFFAVGVTLAAAFSVYRLRRILRSNAASTLSVTTLALTLGFSVLSACVALTYAWRPAVSSQGAIYVAGPALLVFVAVLTGHVILHKPPVASVLVASVLSALAMYFLGLIVWLFTACAFGDCI